MASAAILKMTFPVLVPTTVAATGLLSYRALSFDWRAWATHFFAGPGRKSRILLMLFVWLNWKSMPFMWTFRVFWTLIYHNVIRRRPLQPRALFHYAIVPTRNTLLDSDYNIHKSNSTYFSDLDIARSHLVTHLVTPGWYTVADNAKNKLVRDKDGNLVKGGLSVGLGAVFCSFRKEIAVLQPYEVWTRVLAWDRKWLYMVSHYVVAGKVRPTRWDGRKFGPTRQKVEDKVTGEVQNFSKYVIATAVSKYVFKMGRFTVHPAILLEANNLLPERPGEGWRGGETGVGTPDDLGDMSEESEWDWRRVEWERRKGMEFAGHFAALDGANALFDGGEDGALGRFPIG